jgi:hypothetical protein
MLCDMEHSAQAAERKTQTISFNRALSIPTSQTIFNQLICNMSVSNVIIKIGLNSRAKENTAIQELCCFG